MATLFWEAEGINRVEFKPRPLLPRCVN